MTMLRILLVAFALGGLASAGAEANDRSDFLDKGAKKRTTEELVELFSDTQFRGSQVNVINKADGTRLFEANDNTVTLHWWVNSEGEFCTDTRSGQAWCGIDHYLYKDRLKIFTPDGRTAQEFVVKR